MAEVVHLYSRYEWTLPTLRKASALLDRAPQRAEAKPSGYMPHKLPQRLSEERLDQIAAEYEAGGVSTVKLGKRHGISDSTVRSLLHARGIDTPQRKLSEADIDEVVALYARGHFMKAIGDRFSADRGTVRNALVARGVPLRPHNRRPT